MVNLLTKPRKTLCQVNNFPEATNNYAELREFYQRELKKGRSVLKSRVGSDLGLSTHDYTDPGRSGLLGKGLVGYKIPSSLLDEFLFISNKELRNLIRAPLPEGHKFFPDCEREVMARWIDWVVNLPNTTFTFATLTFKYPISIYIAEKKRNEWLGRISEANRQLTEGSGYLRWVSTTEWQQRDVIHFHLIISGVGLELLSRKRWESRWRIINGNAKWNERFTGCAIYPGNRKAAPYLAKHHIAKRGEIQRGGIWRGLNTPDALRVCGCQHSKRPRLAGRTARVEDELLERPSAGSSRMWGSYPAPKESSNTAYTAL